MKSRTAILSIAIVVILLSVSISAVFIVNNNNDTGNEKTVLNSEMNVLGLEKDGVVSYKGIPYGEAPVGDLRFAPPVEKKQWTETLDCTKWGNIAIQNDLYSSGSPTVHGANESEDCLNLNIWAPADAKPGSNLPVYVWIHGGIFVTDNAQNSSYDGTNFAKSGVIVITVEYRLGALGFLALDSLKGDNSLGTTGNWGTLDQILALQWVQKNIWKFGGDKNNVTLGGESAGSFSVFHLIMSPLTEGLFQKAIMESGMVTRILDASESYESTVAVSHNIIAKLNVEDSEEGIKKLRSMSAFDVADAVVVSTYLSDTNPYSPWPAYDGVVLPSDLIEAAEKGEYNHVKILTGYNLYEGRMFTKSDVTEAEFNSMIDRSFSAEDAVTVKNYYAGRTEMTVFDKTAELTGMLMVKLGETRIEKLFSETGTVYCYQYDHYTNSGTPPLHATEVPFAFGLDEKIDGPFEGDDKIIRDTLHGYLLNFIKNGDPNGKGLSTWTPYSAASDSLMTFYQNNSAMSVREYSEQIDLLLPMYLP